MNTRNTRLHTVTRFAAAATLTLGMLTARTAPAAAQFPTLYGFGDNSVGQLGNQTTQNAATPTGMAFYSHCAELVAKTNTTLMLKLDGTVWGVGLNYYGVLCVGYYSFTTTTPRQIPHLSNVAHIAVSQMGLAVKTDGSVWSWGDNGAGQLGNGVHDSDYHYTPTPVMQYGSPLHPLLNIQSVAAGGYCGFALDTQGYIWTWGDNTDGQLGTGDGQNYPYAVVLRTLPNVKQVVASNHHTLALKSNGTVYAWGKNDYGQLGANTSGDPTTPQLVGGIDHVAAVAANDTYSLALKEDGSVWIWGYFKGLTPTYGNVYPQRIVGFPTLTAISAGGGHILATDSSNNLWGLGDNAKGQLGDPSHGTFQATPVRLTPFIDVANIAAGDNYSIVETYAVSIAGSVRLEGLADNAPPQTITLTLTAPGQADIKRVVTVTNDPYVQIDNLPPTNYTLVIHSAKWLQKVMTLDLSTGNNTSLDVTLRAGDANGDNTVDIADFGLLVNAYGGDSTVTGSNYDVRADFNCDGIVDIADFGLLVNNYGAAGAP